MKYRIFNRRQLLQMAAYTGLGLAILPFTRFKNEKNMLSRPIPSSGEALPVIGLGTWLQFDVGTAAAERQQLREVLQSMAAQGGKLIDSSPMYGRAEQVVGDLTVGSNQFFYATKVWTTGRQAGIDQMNTSLRLMRRTTMDLMQVHNLVDYKTHLNTLEAWKAAGKVRYVGVTHYTTSAHDQLEQVIRDHKPDFVQFNYSIRVRNAERRLLDVAREHGVAVIINEPFEKGTLFGAVKDKALPAWAAEYDIHSWGQFFLKYILSHPAVNCVIPGTSNPNHALDNMGAGYGQMPDEKMRAKMVQVVKGG